MGHTEFDFLFKILLKNLFAIQYKNGNRNPRCIEDANTKQTKQRGIEDAHAKKRRKQNSSHR